MGIWQGDIKREANIPDSLLKKSIKMLITKKLVKEVVNVQNRSKKLLMASDFEPSNEISGGEWYTEGKLDTEFIDKLSEACFSSIRRLKVATCEGILEWIRKAGGGVSKGQMEQILKKLVMENKVQEVTSDGSGDFESVPVGEVCYRLVKKGAGGVGAMASIPCGVCPRINSCTPDGVISPTTCQYYQKWLDF